MNTEETKTENLWTVPVQELNKTINYLQTKPYNEVKNLIGGIVDNAKPVEPSETWTSEEEKK